VLESAILSLYDNFLTSDTLQYGFKNIVVVFMHCLLLMKLWNTSQKEIISLLFLSWCLKGIW